MHRSAKWTRLAKDIPPRDGVSAARLRPSRFHVSALFPGFSRAFVRAFDGRHNPASL
jgi:hypothetical protein